MDIVEGVAIFEAMGDHRLGQGSKLISEPPLAALDEHAELVKADQRFQARLHVAIASGRESVEAMQATVQLKHRRTKLPR